MAKPKDGIDDVIGTADRQLAMALVRVGNRAADSTDPYAETLEVDGYAVQVACKAISPEENAEKFGGLGRHQVLLRVDLAKAQAAGKPVGQELDLWIAKQEGAINALAKAWRNKLGPFVGYSLRHQTIAPDDAWCGHIVTAGNWRTSLWLVGEPWHKIEAVRGGSTRGETFGT